MMDPRIDSLYYKSQNLLSILRYPRGKAHVYMYYPPYMPVAVSGQMECQTGWFTSLITWDFRRAECGS